MSESTNVASEWCWMLMFRIGWIRMYWIWMVSAMDPGRMQPDVCRYRRDVSQVTQCVEGCSVSVSDM